MAAWEFHSGRELYARMSAGGTWTAIDAVPGSGSSSPSHLTVSSDGTRVYYAATTAVGGGPSSLWSTNGATAQDASFGGAISGITGIAAYGSAMLVSTGSPASLLSVSLDGSSYADVLASTGITDPGKPHVGTGAARVLYFLGMQGGVRSLFYVAAPGGAPVAVASGVAAVDPTIVSKGAAYVDGQSGAVKVFVAPFGAVSATTEGVATAVAYAGAGALAPVGAGLCFTAYTDASASDKEIICAGVASGDLAAITRSSSAGVTLGAGHSYLMPMGHIVITGCLIAAQGGPHLCAWNGAAGAMSWSTAGQQAGLAVQYNSFAKVGLELYFAAEVRGGREG